MFDTWSQNEGLDSAVTFSGKHHFKSLGQNLSPLNKKVHFWLTKKTNTWGVAEFTQAPDWDLKSKVAVW